MGINDSLGAGVAKGPSNVVRVQVPSGWVEFVVVLFLFWQIFSGNPLFPVLKDQLSIPIWKTFPIIRGPFNCHCFVSHFL